MNLKAVLLSSHRILSVGTDASKYSPSITYSMSMNGSNVNTIAALSGTWTSLCNDPIVDTLHKNKSDRGNETAWQE